MRTYGLWTPLAGADLSTRRPACHPNFGGPPTAPRVAGILSIGFASGEVAKPPANLLLVKNLSVMGFPTGEGYLDFAPRTGLAAQPVRPEWALFETGRNHPHISATFSLAQARDALELLRSRKSTGKVVVTI